MISKECFVYIQLPNTLETITAGRLEWQKAGENTEIGTFVYGQKYLAHPGRIALDPFNLPLEERNFEVRTNEGVHGPIRDASPDSWGRYLIQKNTPQSEWDQIGYLLNSAEDRVGALSFGHGKVPPAPLRKFNRTVELEKLIEAVEKIEKGEKISDSERAILLAGASLGGARPKTTVEKDNSLWLAKFPGHEDKRNFPKIEFGAMRMAKDFGLNVPDIDLKKIGGRDVFFIKRFDRHYDSETATYRKDHFVSGLTLLNLDESDRTNWSYPDLADQMRRWIVKPKKDLRELFKRIIFNGLISNTDDHPRNHGFLYASKGFHLSPAYDLVPKPEMGSDRYLAMAIGKEGRVFTLNNLLSACEAFEVSPAEAKEMIMEGKKLLGKWKSYYADLNLSASDLGYLEPAFALHENQGIESY